MTDGSERGFTLIELAIVLVIIGLIVGGVLVGRDMIRGAQVRATITQIEGYRTAANTFRDKYGYLPGDIRDPDASRFGFAARGTYAGEGDGNGFIEGISDNTSGGKNEGDFQGCGESAAFWSDLGAAHLIEGTYVGLPNCRMTTSATAVSTYMPAAKLGQGNYIYVWGAPDINGNDDGPNYLGISNVSSIGPFGQMISSPGLTVVQAYIIDQKVDDGLPQSGRVYAFYDGGASGGTWPAWASDATNDYGAPFTTATAGSANTCFDNGGSNGKAQHYSVTQNGGAGVNCALSFRFQ